MENEDINVIRENFPGFDVLPILSSAVKNNMLTAIICGAISLFTPCLFGQLRSTWYYYPLFWVTTVTASGAYILCVYAVVHWDEQELIPYYAAKTNLDPNNLCTGEILATTIFHMESGVTLSLSCLLFIFQFAVNEPSLVLPNAWAILGLVQFYFAYLCFAEVANCVSRVNALKN